MMTRPPVRWVGAITLRNVPIHADGKVVVPSNEFVVNCSRCAVANNAPIVRRTRAPRLVLHLPLHRGNFVRPQNRTQDQIRIATQARYRNASRYIILTPKQESKHESNPRFTEIPSPIAEGLFSTGPLIVNNYDISRARCECRNAILARCDFR